MFGFWDFLLSKTYDFFFIKELSLCHKLKFSNPYIYWTWCCRLLIFQTKIIWGNRIHSFKYLRSTTLCCREIGIRKSEFVSKTQFLSLYSSFKIIKGAVYFSQTQILKSLHFQPELKTLEWDILNPDYLIFVSNGQTFDFLLKQFFLGYSGEKSKTDFSIFESSFHFCI